MKRCPTCGREVNDTAAVCDACEAWAASLVDPVPADAGADAQIGHDTLIGNGAPAASETPLASVPGAGAPSTRPSNSAAPSTAEHAARRREMTLAAVAVVGVGVVAAALLVTRSMPASNVAAAPAAAAPRPAAAPAPRETTAATQAWSSTNQAHWLGANRKGAAFELPAENIVKTWFGPIRPSLVVRCMGKTTQAFVYTGSPLRIEPNAEGKSVTVGMDDQPAARERWPDSDDHDALFAPDGTAFAQRVLGARRVRVGYSPHNAPDVIAEFRVSGLDAVIGPHMKECGWTK